METEFSGSAGSVWVSANMHSCCLTDDLKVMSVETFFNMLSEGSLRIGFIT